MSTLPAGGGPSLAQLGSGQRKLDPERSSVEFHVPTFWGLQTVKGRFKTYEGTLELSRNPAVELKIDASTLDTGNRQRDKHLRSPDFFDAERHPEVTFVSDSAELAGDRLKVQGQLQARGSSIPLELDGKLSATGDELRIEAETEAPHQHLGMVWNRIGMIREPSKLIVKGTLVHQTPSAGGTT